LATRNNNNNNDDELREQTRAALLDLLLSKIKEERFPSASTMDLAEQIMTVDELPAYAAILMDKIAADTYPSQPMIKRLVAYTSPR
jgi:hypothetical protein